MGLSRPPLPALRPFVALLWASDADSDGREAPVREHMLPTGAMHLVVRLGESPLHILSAQPGLQDQSLHGALVGGPRDRYYVRAWSVGSGSVGAMLRPGAALPLLGAPAAEFTGRHVPLEALWGAEAGLLCERLREAADSETRLALFEAALAARLPRVHALHPGIAAVLSCGDTLTRVAEAVELSGLSHRHFLAHFNQCVGLGAKTWLRIRRFQRTLVLLRDGRLPLAAVAAEAGYSDQAHLSREFLALAGVPPSRYRGQPPAQANHLPVGDGVEFLQDVTASAAQIGRHARPPEAWQPTRE